MSYSRWGHSRWYTFWACQRDETENRDTAIFEICPVVSFTAFELRGDMDDCLKEAKDAEERRYPRPVTDAELTELKAYMQEFLSDVDEQYPQTNRKEA